VSDQEQPRKTLTYRELLFALEQNAKQLEDGALDMSVVLRVEDEDGEHHVGSLYDVGVDAGCTDEDALVLDAAEDATGELQQEAYEEPRPARPLPATRLGWLITVLIILWVCSHLAKAIDRADQRECRRSGNHAVWDGREWHCVGEVRP
jgi:hypothetical protein